MARAIGLFSGGLDSILAVRLLADQDVEILAVSFVTPFFGSERAERAAGELGVPFRPVDITEDHLALVRNPRHGYGRNMNPCIDCHALMLKTAAGIMEQEGYDFLFTGEVLGERPKSQNRTALDIVAKESGFPDLVLRPLSAKLLEPTRPEREGLIDRDRLLDISGRSRKRQMALAEAFGITEYPTPAGGCLLTDPIYSKRLRELWDHDPDATADDVGLLSLGRHLRLTSETKLVLGRNQGENEKLRNLFRPGDVRMFVLGVPGPVGLLRGAADDELKRLAASLCARYSDAAPGQEVTVVLTTHGVDEQLAVIPADPEASSRLLV